MKSFRLYVEEKAAVLKPAKTIDEIVAAHGTTREKIEQQIDKGTAVEKEHTTDTGVARTIASQHVFEIADYYDRLEKMESKAEV